MRTAETGAIATGIFDSCFGSQPGQGFTVSSARRPKSARKLCPPVTSTRAPPDKPSKHIDKLDESYHHAAQLNLSQHASNAWGLGRSSLADDPPGADAEGPREEDLLRSRPGGEHKDR